MTATLIRVILTLAWLIYASFHVHWSVIMVLALIFCYCELDAYIMANVWKRVRALERKGD